MHLLSVWNPAYADDALNAHASLLRPLVREALAKDDWDRAFVWWGKVRSSRRRQPIEHLEEILKLGVRLQADDARETHLLRPESADVRLLVHAGGYPASGG